MKSNLIIDNSHYIFVTDKGLNLLIDTGSQTSFCDAIENSTILINNIEHILQPNTSMIHEINNSGLFNTTINALLGMDVLCHHTFDFDKIKSSIVFDTPLEDNEYTHTIPIDINNIMGQQYILLDGEINQVAIRGILDSGACISYLAESYLSNAESIGTIEDYNPILGEINTTEHTVSITLGDYTQNIYVGKMPAMLELMLGMIGVKFVIGLDSIEFKKLRLDLKHKCILF